MNLITIRNQVIMPKLIDMLGRTMAEDIFQKSSFAAAGASNDQEALHMFLEKTCSDPRFIGMWGTRQAEKQKTEWLLLLS